jgi:hypothetical protein
MVQCCSAAVLWAFLTASLVGLILFAPLARGAESAAGGQGEGGFVRLVWSEATRLRVNSPDAATGPYKDRWEAKEKGELTVDVKDAPELIKDARLYLELWGGHPGVAEKSFALNGHKYMLPEHGAADDNCTYSYPLVDLDVSHLRKGENALKFSCRKGTTFWGHYIVDNTCLVLELGENHPDIGELGLSAFAASVTAEPAEGEVEVLALSLRLPEHSTEAIASVEYRGRYLGYDENGDGEGNDWHGFTKAREPQAIIGRSDTAPFRVRWDLSMVPDQKGPMQVKAVVHFRESDDTLYVTALLGGLSMPGREGAGVAIFGPEELPRPFWSRASEAKESTISLPLAPEDIERAELHVNIWDGGKGETPDPFTLNGHPLPVAGEGDHDLIYRVIDIEPSILKKGPNVVRLLSDTEHHGIEICLPGPTLVVRYRKPSASP